MGIFGNLCHDHWDGKFPAVILAAEFVDCLNFTSRYEIYGVTVTATLRPECCVSPRVSPWKCSDPCEQASWSARETQELNQELEVASWGMVNAASQNSRVPMSIL